MRAFYNQKLISLNNDGTSFFSVAKKKSMPDTLLYSPSTKNSIFQINKDL